MLIAELILNQQQHPSNLDRIEHRKLSTYYTANKIVAYTLDDTERELQNLQNEPDVNVLHSLTNDLTTETPNACVDKMDKICHDLREGHLNTKIVVPLPTPRNDSEEFNSNGQMITIIEKQAEGR